MYLILKRGYFLQCILQLFSFLQIESNVFDQLKKTFCMPALLDSMLSKTQRAFPTSYQIPYSRTMPAIYSAKIMLIHLKLTIILLQVHLILHPHGIALTFLKLDSQSRAGDGFYSYHIQQGNKSDKERKMLSFMHIKRFNIFFKYGCNSVWVQFHVYPCCIIKLLIFFYLQDFSLNALPTSRQRKLSLLISLLFCCILVNCFFL